MFSFKDSLSKTIFFFISNTVSIIYIILLTFTFINKTVTQIANIIIAKIAALLMIFIKNISFIKLMINYEIDLLMMAEMWNWIFKEMNAVVLILKLLKSKNILRLTEIIMRWSRLIDEKILKEKLISFWAIL